MIEGEAEVKSRFFELGEQEEAGGRHAIGRSSGPRRPGCSTLHDHSGIDRTAGNVPAQMNFYNYPFLIQYFLHPII